MTRRRVTALSGWVLGAALLTLPAAAQDKLTERTLRLAEGAESPPATLEDIAWLAGHWVGEALGGEVEEVWSPPRAGAMMGMFRLLRGGETAFYELMTIVEENGSLMLRLKHFNADLTGWEEKAETVDFPLVATGSLATGEGGGGGTAAEVTAGADAVDAGVAGSAHAAVHFQGLSFVPGRDDGEMTLYLAIRQKDGTFNEVSFPYSRAGTEKR